MRSDLNKSAPGFDLRHVFDENGQRGSFHKKAREMRISDVFKNLPTKTPVFTSKCPTCGMRIRGRRDYARHREVAHGIKPNFYKGYIERVYL